MDANDLIAKAKAARDGFVSITFPKSLLGIRALNNLITYGAIPHPRDEGAIRHTRNCKVWGSLATFGFRGIATIEENILYQLARDIEKAT